MTPLQQLARAIHDQGNLIEHDFVPELDPYEEKLDDWRNATLLLADAVRELGSGIDMVPIYELIEYRLFDYSTHLYQRVSDEEKGVRRLFGAPGELAGSALGSNR